MTTLDAAHAYLDRYGWHSIPVPHRKKRPILEGWQNLRLSEEDLPSYFNGHPRNIGVLLGEPSGGLLDVDLDCPEAIQLAPYFLPETLTFGRESKLRSHWLYVAEPADSLPEPAKTITGEFARIGAYPHIQMAVVPHQIKDSVGDDFSLGPTGEIMIKGFKRGLAIHPSVTIELAQVLLLLGVDAEQGIADLDVCLLEVVDIFELGVPIGRLPPRKHLDNFAFPNIMFAEPLLDDGGTQRGA